jgi:hypothetical protein
LKGPDAMPRNYLDFDFVREIAQGLADVQESAGRGAPSLKVHGKLLACPAIHRSAEEHSLVVKIGFDQRAKLIAEDPDVYYVTQHYVKYPSVLVRMSRIHPDALRGLLRMAGQFVSSETNIRKKGVPRGRAS